MANHYIAWTTSVSLMGSSTGRQALPIGTSGRWSTGTIDLSSHIGAQIVFDLYSSSTAASCKDIEYEIMAGLTTANFDDIPLLSGSVSSSPNPSQISVTLIGVKLARCKVTQSSSNDSHQAWIHYSRFHYKTT